MGEKGVDQYGHVWTREPSGDGCLGSPLLILGVLVIVILVGICAFFLAAGNYFTYHEFTADTGQAQQLATATVAETYHIMEMATSAERNGQTSYCQIGQGCNRNGNVSDPPSIQIYKGGTVTFQVTAPEASMYYLCIDGDTDGGSGVTVQVTVNGKLFITADGEDTNSVFGSKSPDTCVNDYPVQLQQGTNSIQVSVVSTKCWDNGNCNSFFVTDIVLDRKFS